MALNVEGKSILVDTDASGINDDAMALHLLFSSGVRIAGISTVFGNLSAAESAVHAQSIAERYGLQHSVRSGAEAPLRWRREDRGNLRTTLEQIGRQTHLGSLDLQRGSVWFQPYGGSQESDPPTIGPSLKTGAISDVLSLGPLTNIAQAVIGLDSPVLSETCFWVAGGSFANGNLGPFAEFNFFCDPDAASFALAAGWRQVVIVPLEISGQVRMTLDWVHHLAAGGSMLGRDLADLEHNYPRGEDRSREPIWDAVAALFCVSALNLRVQTRRVEVVRRGVQRGMLTDSRTGPSVSVVCDIDPAATLAAMQCILEGGKANGSR